MEDPCALNLFDDASTACYDVTVYMLYRATVVHEKDEYWLRVTSQTLRHNERCGQAASQSTRPLFPGALALALSVASSVLLISTLTPVRRGSR